MEYFFRFEHPGLLMISFGVLAGAVAARWWWHKSIQFRYSLGAVIAEQQQQSHHPFKKILEGLQLLAMVLIACAIGKPQLVDSRSNIIVEGIDIMLALDASGSMQFQDCSDDDRSRFEVAKDEAVRFIEKRPNDAIGLVIFGKVALSRCPLTMDKRIITELIQDLELGDIDPDATMLATAMMTAINRLKSSVAKSKVIILLTDGEPSPGDIDPDVAVKIAQKFGIKVYTIGIGSDRDEMILHPFGGLMQKPKVNTPLLQKIARETGGKFFMAHNDRDMRTIYDTIDRLEQTEHESPLYSRYADIYAPMIIAALLLLFIGQLLGSGVWFSI